MKIDDCCVGDNIIINYSNLCIFWCYLFEGDILMSAFISVLVLQRLHPVVWTPVTCRLHTVLHFLPLYLGINTIMLVAVERFVAIALPMHFQAFVTSRMVKLQLALAWLVTILELIVPIIVVKVNYVLRLFYCCTIWCS